MIEKTFKPIISVDFDGVIHLYRKGWTDDVTIDDEVHPEFFDWVNSIKDHYRVVVFSSRSKEVRGVLAMHTWLKFQFDLWTTKFTDWPRGVWEAIEFSFYKPPAFLTIDDRAVTFLGSFEPFTPENLKNFQPWYKVEATPMVVRAKMVMGMLTGPERVEVMAGYCPECGTVDRIKVCDCRRAK